MKTYSKSLFIFHRDLRLHDNTGLIAACTQSKTVIPCFIFTPEQIGTSNHYKSDNAVQFMIESLHDLAEQLEHKKGRLFLFHDETEKIIKNLIKHEKIDAVFSNKDYTPFAQKRDKALAKLCKEHNVDFHIFDDTLMNAPGTVLTGAKEPYKVFTPFWKSSVKHPVAKDISLHAAHFYTKAVRGAERDTIYKKIFLATNPDLAVHGGRKNALKIVKHLADFRTYLKTRDTPSIDTTLLSAHLKFGTVSPRELYHCMRESLGASAQSGLIRQLYWRDFWYHVAYFWPNVFGHAFQDEYNNLEWSSSKKNFETWCEGNTGFPIVDAGMRQLNKTGFMHNRVRMIVASFLIKDLHIDWRKGEHYFAQKLVDYDPCVNNGNWQWSASTGCDPQPYFRIFNPWLQQKKFDPDCVYIKKWIPELADLPSKAIHSWYKQPVANIDYPRPIVDHETERSKALALYKKCLKK